jgi:hypothetical protein
MFYNIYGIHDVIIVYIIIFFKIFMKIFHIFVVEAYFVEY